jgi:hypothetical protein
LSDTGLWQALTANGNYLCNDAFDDEDPLPACGVAEAIHLNQGVRKDATESTDEDAGEVEPGQSLLDFVANVPTCHQVDTASQTSATICPKE